MNDVLPITDGFRNTPSSMPAHAAGGGVAIVAAQAPCASPSDAAGSRGVADEGVNHSPALTISNEMPADIAQRDALLDRAMGPRWRNKSSEKLRRGRLPSEGLALVARGDEGAVVGTVRLWNVTVGDQGPAALLLGPLAVDPAVKSAGIGSALMRHAIAEATRLGHGAILLVGDAPYYARFGFSAEKTVRMAMPGPFEPQRFLALELKQYALTGATGVLKASERKVKAARVALAA